MCNLARLRAARADLPLPSPFNKMWEKIGKVIDTFHLNNHKNHDCHIMYDPKQIKDRFPNLFSANTEAAEGTFAWLGKFKQAMFKMPKYRQLFFLHRLVLRRNLYLEKCHLESKAPLGNFSRDRRPAENQNPE
jgi:hypothetical protein